MSIEDKLLRMKEETDKINERLDDLEKEPDSSEKYNEVLGLLRKLMELSGEKYE